MDEEEIRQGKEIYDHFFEIGYSDEWTLNKLLQYALELIISDDEDCVPSDLSEDHSEVRKLMLDEIENAIIEQTKNQNIPPMPVIAVNLSCLGTFLGNDELEKLEKLLNGEYRGKRGIKKDFKITKQDDVQRMEIYKNHRKTVTHEEAISRLAQQENIHERSAERAVKRGKEYENANKFTSANGRVSNVLEIVKSCRRKIIKDEMQRILDYSNSATRTDYKSKGHLIELIGILDAANHQDT